MWGEYMATTTNDYHNNMSALINKIERRLGLIPLTPYLPDEYNKEKWADVIKDDSLVTFSRYYHKKQKFRVTNTTAPKKNGWHYIDESYIGNRQIIGIGDIDWSDFSATNSMALTQQYGYGITGLGGGMATNLSLGAISDIINANNYASMFSNTVIPVFEEPNRLKLVSVGNSDVDIGEFVINLYVKHSDDLTTISPTKMETFESLAQSDVANFLYENLKYWDGLETVLSNADLKLARLQEEGQKRESIVDKLENSYVSAGNEAIQIMMTI